MASEVQLTGYMRKGVLTIRNLELLGQLSNGEVLVTVARAYATRSPEANRFYWGFIVTPIAEHTGYTPEEIHEILKAKFLPRIIEVPREDGEIVAELTLGGSTRKLNKKQFKDYIEAIREWAMSELELSLAPNGQED